MALTIEGRKVGTATLVVDRRDHSVEIKEIEPPHLRGIINQGCTIFIMEQNKKAAKRARK